MPRVTRVPRMSVMSPSDVGPEVRAIFDRYLQVRGNIPNMFRTLSRRPEIAITADAHMNAIIQTGTVSVALKEMCAVRTSANNKCAY